MWPLVLAVLFAVAGPTSPRPDLPAEDARLVAHFDSVLADLQAADTRRLAPGPLVARARLIETLAGYRDAGRFPRNLDHAGPTPIFIDAYGTRCAMAHLIETADGAELVRHVTETRNFAYIEELRDEPGLTAWLDAHGLTEAEAARIQPTYCESAALCFCWAAFEIEDHPMGDLASSPFYEGTVVEAAVLRIDRAIPEDAAGPAAAGDRLPFSGYGPVETRLLGLVRAGPPAGFVATHIVDEAGSHCHPDGWGFDFGDGEGAPLGPAVPVEEVVEANGSTMCRSRLAGAHPALERSGVDWNEGYTCDPYVDEYRPDAGAPPDAGTPDAEALDAAAGSETPVDSADGDDGCATALGPASPTAALLMTALAAALRRPRRRAQGAVRTRT